ncbi:hypothetical protein [Rhizobium ruizarguesonis]|uniref:hypothetical protein n=1 Tax=Rhizobium ruizarguesonis TaxID=2081791 RepID=UPI0010313FCF|nr:hypothetical protein [Rhizobium ruizarguesonis]NEI32161.1 hypothetical protein [Rhizobium ruizarguesonis]TBB79470.1 hypothetical protein ELH38_37885 [Rhizobium ruizarguesonis]
MPIFRFIASFAITSLIFGGLPAFGADCSVNVGAAEYNTTTGMQTYIVSYDYTPEGGSPTFSMNVEIETFVPGAIRERGTNPLILAGLPAGRFNASTGFVSGGPVQSVIVTGAECYP